MTPVKLPESEPNFVTVDGRRIAYDEVSPTEPRGTILLLTGLGSKRLAWFKQLKVFGKHYRTLAIDHRDTGDSDAVSSPYSTADQADDAAGVLRALGIEKAHVLGISMGGFVALELVLGHPELVDRLVLASTSAGGPEHVQPGPEIMAMMTMREQLEIGELSRKMYGQITAPGHFERHPADWEILPEIARYRPMNDRTYVRQLQACLGHDVAERLEQIQAPTLVVHGEGDPLVPMENGLNLAKRIPNARLITYPEIGHVPTLELPEQFNRDVLAFLGE